MFTIKYKRTYSQQSERRYSLMYCIIHTIPQEISIPYFNKILMSVLESMASPESWLSSALYHKKNEEIVSSALIVKILMIIVPTIMQISCGKHVITFCVCVHIYDKNKALRKNNSELYKAQIIIFYNRVVNIL